MTPSNSFHNSGQFFLTKSKNGLRKAKTYQKGTCFPHNQRCSLIWLFRCDDEKAILTAYPPNYSPKDSELTHSLKPVFLCASHFDRNKMLRIKGKELIDEQSEPVFFFSFVSSRPCFCLVDEKKADFWRSKMTSEDSIPGPY